MGSQFTWWIDCSIGLKQGCALSPTLFALYMVELSKRLMLSKGVKIGNCNLPALFFADYIVLLAKTDESLAEKIKILKKIVEISQILVHENKQAKIQTDTICRLQKVNTKHKPYTRAQTIILKQWTTISILVSRSVIREPSLCNTTQNRITQDQSPEHPYYMHVRNKNTTFAEK